jgi:hypothetical protein
MTIAIDAIRECFEGAVPAMVATSAPDGTPNVSYVSQVHYVDRDHVALSFQFFSKTRENVLANPCAAVLVIHPPTAAQYRLSLRYLRTETEGPLFEGMKARLAGIASHEGMSAVFRLRGSDVYRVLGVERVRGVCVQPAARRNHVSAVRNCAVQLAAATDLAQLLDALLDGLGREFGIAHAMVLMADEANQRLYTVASRGYDASGVGWEIRFGDGVIGVAARERTPIRITYMQSEYGYGRTVRDALAADDRARALDAEIPFPGLPNSGSQLAVPIVAGMQLLGVLYVESPENGRFGYDDEDALVALACQLAPVAVLLNQPETGAGDDPQAASAARPVVTGRPVRVRHYAVNDSVFIDDDYLIKGVAGAILWKLLRDHVLHQRVEFSNRELRLDPSIRLPELSENLEARLVLLARRLAERCPFIRFEKTGRGRFRLCVARPVELLDVAA